MIEILWHEKESQGYIDRIPLEWLLLEGEKQECLHDVIGPRKGVTKAKCKVIVRDAEADFDYNPFEDFNQQKDMLIGVMKLKFVNNNRNSVSQVLWKQKGEKIFKPCSTTITYAFSTHEDIDKKVIESLRLSPEERQKRLSLAKKIPEKIQVVSVSYRRNPDVVAEILYRSKGICQNCKKSAPFIKSSTGEPYLEVHHLVRLANGGDDTVENAVALCPNCHRKAHYGSA